MKGSKSSLEKIKGNSKRKKFIIVGECFLAVILVIAITVTLILIKKNNSKETDDANISTVSAINPASTELSKNDVKSEFSIKFLYPEDYWAKYDLKYAAYKTKADYETAVLKYIDQITTLLGKKDWYKQYADNDNSISLKLLISETAPAPCENIICPYDYNTGIVTFNISLTNIDFRMDEQFELLPQLTHLVTYNKKEKEFLSKYPVITLEDHDFSTRRAGNYTDGNRNGNGYFN